MLIGLMVFAIIIFPLSMLPIKAIEQTQSSKEIGVTAFEMHSFFNRFGKEVGLSYRFLPEIKGATFVGIGSGSTNSFKTNKQIFFAYRDEGSQKVRRVGYQFKEETAGSGKWQLLRAEIPENANLEDYAPNGSAWKSTFKIAGTTDFYITGEKDSAGNITEPSFAFCRESSCSEDIKPQDADGVRIQSGSIKTTGNPSNPNPPPSPLGLYFTYRSSTSYIRPMYYRLASLQSNPHRNAAEQQLLPFSMSIAYWNETKNWLMEKSVTSSDGSTFKVPIDKSGDITSATKLPIRDFHFNYRTGELLAVSNTTPSANANPERNGLYIFKFKPGLPDYRPYILDLANSMQSYAEKFPVAIHSGEPGAVITFDANNQAEFLSVTQDSEDNIYVLTVIARQSPMVDYEYYVQKFSPDGEYVSKFNLGSQQSNNFQALGITFNPATPNEVLVLCRTGITPLNENSGTLVIQAYPKDQNTTQASGVLVSAKSVQLDSTAAKSKFSNFNWGASLRGFEYDPLHHRFLLLSEKSSSSTPVLQILSLDTDFDAENLDRAGYVQQVYFRNAPASSDTTPTGLAFDPKNNHAYVAVVHTSSPSSIYGYYQVVPNTLLNAVVKKPE